MKKIYLLLVLLIIFAGCEKDEVTSRPEQIPTNEKSIQQIDFEDLPVNVSKFFNSRKAILRNENKSNMMFGEARTDIPVVKIINKNGKASFTIALGKTGHLKSSSLYFDNFVVQELQDGNQKEYIFRYRPQNNWYNKDRDLATYTGTVQVFDLEGGSLGQMDISNGKLVPNQQKEFAKKECFVLLDYIFCVGGIYDESSSCTYYYSLHCYQTGGAGSGGGTGGGGDNENPNPGDNGDEPNPDPDGGSGTGGGGDGSGDDGTDDDGVTTLPIPVGEGMYEDIIDTDALNNPCVEGIIEELQAKDDHLSVIPELGTEVSHISQLILDLFDNSHEYSLYFEINQLGTNFQGYEINGSTTPYLNGWKIELDSDLVNNGTQLFTAKTIIHESVHAWIGYILKENRTSNMVTNLNLIYQKFKNSNNAFNLTQHEFMGQFVETMGASLAAYDNHRQSPDYYTKLSWGGLETSSAYQQLRNKSEIQNIISNERFNKDNAKGIPCP